MIPNNNPIKIYCDNCGDTEHVIKILLVNDSAYLRCGRCSAIRHFPGLEHAQDTLEDFLR